jgi:enoyl-CoA hydratase/carnithine racemase
VSTYEQIIVEPVDAVLRITLNRPEKLNAWTPQMMGELTEAIVTANDDPAIGAIVVTGAGRGFCAGADVGAVFDKGLHGGHDEEPRQPPRQDWVGLCRQSKPLVAAINGPSIGVGLTLVLPFDQILAAKGAKLSCRFVKMGLVPELASSHFLTARCGFGAASWLALSGTTVLAEEAKELGLVDRVVEPDDLLATAMDVAAELASNPPTQVRLIKELLTVNADESDLGTVQRREIDAMQVAYKTPEHAEAVAAFLEKRPPVFR